ncbi:MAG: outer membrane porin, OprD family [Oceanospirillaceae bacterium]|nr:outer membrane porin, OprD family [Oceanospirillaceae bacterium]
MKKLLIITSLISPFVCADSNSFFSDSQLNFELQNKYNGILSSRYNKNGQDSLLNWAQTVSMDFKSGYINDTLGFDLGLYAIDPIKTGNQFQHIKVLDYTTDSNGTPDPKGFAKVQTATLKQKFKISDFDVDLYEGQRVLRDFGALNRTDEFTESAYFGLTGEAKSKKWEIKSGYITQYSEASSPHKVDLETKDNHKIDYIYTVDATYNKDNKSFRYYIGEGKDYMRSQMLSFKYGFKNKSVTAKIVSSTALAKYKDMPSYNRLFEDNAYLGEIKFESFSRSSYLAVGIDHVQANRSYSIGKFENDLSGNSVGNNTYMAHGFTKDFTNNAETSIAAMYFNDVTDELKIGLMTQYGFGFKYKGEDISEYELIAVGIYSPQAVKGLSITLAGGPNHSFRRSYDNTPYLNNNGNVMKFTGSSYIAKVTYSF